MTYWASTCLIGRAPALLGGHLSYWEGNYEECQPNGGRVSYTQTDIAGCTRTYTGYKGRTMQREHVQEAAVGRAAVSGT